MGTENIVVIYVEGKYFLNESICNHNQIGDNSVFVIINKEYYYQVTPEEIGALCAANHSSFALQRESDLKIYLALPEETPDHEFDVCCYKDHYYVNQSILQQFHLQPLEGQITVDGTVYFEVSLQQISIIEGSSIYGIWQANYKNVSVD